MDVGRLAMEMAAATAGDARMARAFADHLPDPHTARHLIERLRGILFPGLHGQRDFDEESLAPRLERELADFHGDLLHQVEGAFVHWGDEGASSRSKEATDAVLEALPAIRDLLSLDVQAAYDGDPAACHIDEVMLCYPGIRALTTHRFAHAMIRVGIPLLPRIMQEHAHSDTGIDIHPAAEIGESFFIDHGTGVVIGETTQIGDHGKVYQGVTLGARSFEVDDNGVMRRGMKRHPTLGNHVTVYAGATILGGDTVIGDGCVVAGGVFLSRSVPAGHIVAGPRPEIRLIANSV
ncbi:MAG: serine O-acetyltransferase [Phycisphaerales bacterium]|nr:serine O-acetyltransferase [Phycisphaerales bacterium]